MGHARQEYWSGLPFPSKGDFPSPGIKRTSPVSPALAGRLVSTEPPSKHTGMAGKLPLPQGEAQGVYQEKH